MLEILAVIAIIAILGLLSVPYIANTGNSVRLQGSSTSIFELCQIARDYAVNNRTTTTLTVDLDSNNIQVKEGANLLEKIWAAPARVDIVDISTAATNNVAGAINLDFQSNGQPTISGGTGNDVYIHLIISANQINGAAYDGTSDYTAYNNEERVKCHTIKISGSTGLPVVMHYGLGDPWATSTL